ncbi:MAG TPA: phosphoribosyltransferase family protein [Solirubrobacterales bacterium]|nr:phosphoribosyltransferase family protein [Solirubrobacterales bacterium]
MVERLALFADRRDAGRRLGEALGRFRDEDPVVLALPRGGVPVGYEVARALGAPLDIVLVRKLGSPFNPEYGIGAIAEGGIRFVREDDVELTGIRPAELEEVVARETAELERRQHLYRGEREPLPVEGRTAILVDDGVATGGTAVAAGQALKARGARQVVFAVPVGPPGTEARLGEAFDEVVCLEQPYGFFGIGQFYVSFEQLGDDEVTALLEAEREPGSSREAAADPPPPSEQPVEIEAAPGLRLSGDLCLPEGARALILFAHGSGSSRLSPRNREVAGSLNRAGLATLLFDLLTDEEAQDRAKVFDVELLADRLAAATRWAAGEPSLRGLPLGYFGASTGAAAALLAAARLGDEIGAVVSRGGRPDLAGAALERVVSPTLLIVGGADWQVLELNEEAARALHCEREVAIVPGATHLFEEPGALERVAALARDWLLRHLGGAGAPADGISPGRGARGRARRS